WIYSFYFFFFQAEDGIRDKLVTGVQTCALPISPLRSDERSNSMSSNEDLINDVNDELFWDPKVDNTAIAVSADDGRIALRGTVEIGRASCRERAENSATEEAVNKKSNQTDGARY